MLLPWAGFTRQDSWVLEAGGGLSALKPVLRGASPEDYNQ